MSLNDLAVSTWNESRDVFFQGAYFERLSKGLFTIEELAETQKPFFFAVARWSNFFLRLASRTHSLPLKKALVENVMDEISLDHDSPNAPCHEESFTELLKHLGAKVPESPVPQVQWFLDAVDEICNDWSVRDAGIFLATIELVFADVSSFLATELMKLTKSTNIPHYAVHENLDVTHAKELFDAVDKAGLQRTCGEVSVIRHAIATFSQLYDDLETVHPASALMFGNVFEDVSVELKLLKNCFAHEKPEKLSVCCVASAGCTAMQLAAKGHRVTTVDKSKQQLAYVRERLSGKGSTKRTGLYERTFQLVPFFRTRLEQLFNRRRLTFIFGPKAVGDATDEVFRSLFEQAIQAQSNSKGRIASLMTYEIGRAHV